MARRRTGNSTIGLHTVAQSQTVLRIHHQDRLRSFGASAHAVSYVSKVSTGGGEIDMFSKAIRTAVIGSIVLTAVGSSAQANPFFEGAGATANTHYEVLPQAVKQLCKKELSGWKDPFTVYAHVKSAEFEYYAVWGSGSEDEYDRASALEIHGNVCRAADLEQVLGAQPPRNGYRGATSVAKLPWNDSPFEGTPPNRVTVFRSVEEEMLFRKFVRDAIQRDVKAHGGDKLYKQEACKESVESELQGAGYVVVLEELKAYCSKTSGEF